MRVYWKVYGSGGWLIVLVVNRHRFEVLSFEYLVTIQASDIVDPIAPRQYLGSGMLAHLHSGEDYPYSKRPNSLVKPLSPNCEQAALGFK